MALGEFRKQKESGRRRDKKNWALKKYAFKTTTSPNERKAARTPFRAKRTLCSQSMTTPGPPSKERGCTYPLFCVRPERSESPSCAAAKLHANPVGNTQRFALVGLCAPPTRFKISVGLGFRVFILCVSPRREAFEPPRQRPPGRAPGGNTYTTLYTHRHQRRRRRVGERRGVKWNVRLDGRTKMSAPRLLLNRRGRTIRDNILIHYYFLYRHIESERQR